jgi:hypothetical protein
MADILTGYGSSGQAVTITLASLGDSATAGRESTSVDNSSSKFLDVLITAKVKTQNSGSIVAPSAAFVYAYATVDGGSEWPDTVTGSDAAITINNPTQLKLLGAIYAAAINTTYKGGPWSLASLFGGKMPQKWGVVIINDMGTALSATGSDHGVEYQGIYATAT